MRERPWRRRQREKRAETKKRGASFSPRFASFFFYSLLSFLFRLCELMIDFGCWGILVSILSEEEREGEGGRKKHSINDPSCSSTLFLGLSFSFQNLLWPFPSLCFLHLCVCMCVCTCVCVPTEVRERGSCARPCARCLSRFVLSLRSFLFRA